MLLVIAIFRLIFLILYLGTATGTKAPIPEINVDDVVTINLSANKSITYSLPANIYPVFVSVQNIGIDSYAELIDSMKSKFSASWMGKTGSYIIFVPAKKISQELRIKAVEPNAQIGQVQIKVISLQNCNSTYCNAIVSMALAHHYRYNHYQGADDKRESAAQMFSESAKHFLNSPLEAIALYEAGVAWKELQNYQLSIKHLKAAYDIWLSQGHEVSAYQALNLIGLIQLELSQYKQALYSFKKVSQYAKTNQLSDLASMALNNMGLIEMQLGHYYSASQKYHESLSVKNISLTIENKSVQSIMEQLAGFTFNELTATVNNLALANDALGNVDKAQLLWEVYLKMTETVSNQSAVARAQNNLAVLKIAQGQFEAARVMLNSAIKTFTSRQDTKWLSLAAHNLGQLYLELSEYDLAMIQFNKAITMRSINNNPKGYFESHIKLIEIHLERNQTEDARTLINKMENIPTLRENTQASIMILYFKHLIALKDNKLKSAEKHIHHAIKLAAGQSYQRLIARLNVARANVLIEQGSFKIAIDELRTEIRKLINIWDVESLNYARRLLAWSLYKNDQIDSANEVILFEISSLENNIKKNNNHRIVSKLKLKLKQTLNLYLAINQTNKNVISVYQTYNQLLLNTNQIKNKESRTPQKESSTILNQLEAKSYALENSQLAVNDRNQIQAELIELKAQLEFSYKGSSLSDTELFDTESLQLQLDEETLLIQFTVGHHGAHSWWVTRQGITKHDLPVRSVLLTQINASLTEFRGLTSGFRNTINLSKSLLDPLSNYPDIKRILLVLDEPLNLLPFSALGDPRTNYNQPLSDSIELQRKLNINFESLPLKQTNNLNLLLVTDPVTSTLDERLSHLNLRHDNDTDFPRLDGTLNEAKAIKKVMSTKHLNGFKANKKGLLKNDLKQVDLLHFATHGFFNHKFPELSALVLSAYDINGNKQAAFVRSYEIKNWNLTANLVVLSGCETGISGIDLAYGFDGLSKSFLEAGAKQLVASLWQVNDSISTELMTHFYSQYSKGKSASQSLSMAQSIVRTNPATSHPKYWAGWFLMSQ